MTDSPETAKAIGILVIAPGIADFNIRARAIAVARDLITPAKFLLCSDAGRSRDKSHE
ncbi:hypothetical protein ACQPZ2_15280 [Nocardia pseudovaccinii]|uniref:hypothetical protein n=1 Tax=Nocardia pseudovaccinii TaxID=189540 RepID=UPI003D8D82CC